MYTTLYIDIQIKIYIIKINKNLKKWEKFLKIQSWFLDKVYPKKLILLWLWQTMIVNVKQTIKKQKH